MNNFNSINLNLYQPIIYNKERSLQTQDIEKAYDFLIKKLDKNGIAAEACIKIQYNSNDSIEFNAEELGFAESPSQAVIDAVKEAKEIPLENHDMEIKPGNYKFIQLPFLPTKENLFATLLQIACSITKKNNGFFYLRLLKENSIVILAQIIIELEK